MEHNLKTGYKKTIFGNLANIIQVSNDMMRISSTENDKLVNNYDEEFSFDCKGYDIVPTVLPKAKRIIVIGDTHGDFDVTIRSLTVSNVIDKNYNWIAEPDTIVVQVGDQIDRCRPHTYDCDDERATYRDEASDIKIMKFFTNLDKQAKNNGGRVISLLGNHEILNSLGIMTYVSYEGRKEFENYKDPKTGQVIKEGTRGRVHAFKPGNEMANFMACTRVSCIIIGSNLFVHAAIVPMLMEKYSVQDVSGIERINTLIRKWLLDQIKMKNVYEILNSEKISPFWPRILGYIPPNALTNNNEICSTYLNPVLKTLKLGNMIIGHTPQFYAHDEGINSTCDSKLWRVDIGSSKAFNSFDKCTQSNCDHKNCTKTIKKTYDSFNKLIEDNELISEKRRVQVLEILNDNTFNVIKDEFFAKQVSSNS